MCEWTFGAGGGLARAEAQTSLSEKPIGELRMLSLHGGQSLLQAVATATSESSMMGETTSDQGHVLSKSDALN